MGIESLSMIEKRGNEEKIERKEKKKAKREEKEKKRV